MSDLGWAALRSAALVGTGRRPVPASVAGVLPRASATSEMQLLDQVAVVGAALRAGRPAERQVSPAAAPSDEARDPTPLQAQLLALAIRQPPAGARMQAALVVFWCRHAASAGVHAPPALLPELMGLATIDRALRPTVGQVLDRRGEWLATQNKDWRWARRTRGPEGPIPTMTDWSHLPSAARAAHLSVLRASDPSTARELLIGSWATESAKDRAALLEALTTGLSLADEELLERALDDSSRAVRQQAAGLLSRLPGSARAARMRARLAPLVTQRGLMHKELVVELPDDPDPAAVRDGLSRASAGHSQRGWWLRELIVGTPLSFWTDAFGADQHAVVVRIQKNQEALHALAEAAVVQRDADWAAVLVPHAEGPALSRLIEVLPAPVVEHGARALLGRSDVDRQLRFLAAIPAFSPRLSRELIAAMGNPKTGPRLVLRDEALLARLHPACLPELIALSRRADLDRSEHRTVTELVQLFSVQQSISEAFT